MVAARQRILRIPRLAIEDVRQGYLTHCLLPAGVVYHGVLREDVWGLSPAVLLPVEVDQSMCHQTRLVLTLPSALENGQTKKTNLHVFGKLRLDTLIGRPHAPAASHIVSSTEGRVVASSSGQLQNHRRMSPIR